MNVIKIKFNQKLLFIKSLWLRALIKYPNSVKIMVYLFIGLFVNVITQENNNLVYCMMNEDNSSIDYKAFNDTVAKFKEVLAMPHISEEARKEVQEEYADYLALHAAYVDSVVNAPSKSDEEIDKLLEERYRKEQESNSPEEGVVEETELAFSSWDKIFTITGHGSNSTVVPEASVQESNFNAVPEAVPDVLQRLRNNDVGDLPYQSRGSYVYKKLSTPGQLTDVQLKGANEIMDSHIRYLEKMNELDPSTSSTSGDPDKTSQPFNLKEFLIKVVLVLALAGLIWLAYHYFGLWFTGKDIIGLSGQALHTVVAAKYEALKNDPQLMEKLYNYLTNL